MLVLAMQFSRGRYYADSGDVSTSPASIPSINGEGPGSDWSRSMQTPSPKGLGEGNSLKTEQ